MAAKWNGEPAKCRQVKVIVGEPDRPTWWFACLVGTERLAVEVTQDGHTFYLDDEDGSGTKKVLIGNGMWTSPHRSLNITRVVAEIKELT